MAACSGTDLHSVVYWSIVINILLLPKQAHQRKLAAELVCFFGGPPFFLRRAPMQNNQKSVTWIRTSDERLQSA